MSEKRDIQISKALSYLLRHGAVKEKLDIDQQGYVKLSQVLSNNRLKTYKATEEDINRIVENNNKKRFTLVERGDGSGVYICANQGHSLKAVTSDNLRRLSAADFPQQIIHGTTRQKLALILQSGGLSKMNRNHIHFTSKLDTDETTHIVTGIRNFANVLIYIDLTKIIESKDDSIIFYKSLNDVYLTEGNDKGILPKEYFLKVVDRKTGELIPF